MCSVPASHILTLFFLRALPPLLSEAHPSLQAPSQDLLRSLFTLSSELLASVECAVLSRGAHLVTKGNQSRSLVSAVPAVNGTAPAPLPAHCVNSPQPSTIGTKAKAGYPGPAMVIHTCNLSTGKGEAGELPKVQSQSRLWDDNLFCIE